MIQKLPPLALADGISALARSIVISVSSLARAAKIFIINTVRRFIGSV